MYSVAATKLSLTRQYDDMYPLVSGYKLLVRDTCIRLHVSGVNAVLLQYWCRRYISYNTPRFTCVHALENNAVNVSNVDKNDRKIWTHAWKNEGRTENFPFSFVPSRLPLPFLFLFSFLTLPFSFSSISLPISQIQLGGLRSAGASF